MTRIRSRAASLAGWILAGAIGLGLIGQGGRFSDQADAVNLVAPLWIGLGFAAGVILLLAVQATRPRLWAGGGLGALALIAFALYPSPFARDVTASDCGSIPLRLVQFNIRKDNPDIPAVVAWIEGTDADVVTLEEAASELPVIAMLRARYPYAVACAAGMRCSTVILSRRPFLASGGLAQGDPENRQALSAAWATLATKAGPFTIVAAHLDRPWPWHNRPEDQTELVDFVRRHDPQSTLIAGDFNRPPASFQLHRLTAALGMARAPDIRTWPATPFAPPLLAIDHLFSGARWTIARLARGPNLGSDHHPLVADLRLTAETCH